MHFLTSSDNFLLELSMILVFHFESVASDPQKIRLKNNIEKTLNFNETFNQRLIQNIKRKMSIMNDLIIILLIFKKKLRV